MATAIRDRRPASNSTAEWEDKTYDLQLSRINTTERRFRRQRHRHHHAIRARRMVIDGSHRRGAEKVG